MGVIEQVSRYDAHINAVLLAHQKRTTEQVAASIEQLQRRGLADATLDPMIAAVALGGMVSRFAETWLVQGYPDCNFDDAVEQITTMFVNALQLKDEPGEVRSPVVASSRRSRVENGGRGCVERARPLHRDRAGATRCQGRAPRAAPRAARRRGGAGRTGHARHPMRRHRGVVVPGGDRRGRGRVGRHRCPRVRDRHRPPRPSGRHRRGHVAPSIRHQRHRRGARDRRRASPTSPSRPAPPPTCRR